LIASSYNLPSFVIMHIQCDNKGLNDSSQEHCTLRVRWDAAEN
jgi:hypothetical protein